MLSRQGSKYDRLLQILLDSHEAASRVVGLLGCRAPRFADLQFVTPHQMPEILVVPPESQKETANLTALCPVQSFVLAGVWWNLEATHYYEVDQGIVCHSVVPQYNLHGNYFIGSEKTTPYHTAPSPCANDSYPFDLYMYHGSVGYYSYYEGEVGTYCTEDKTAYIVVEVLGTYDINGVFLAEDTGSTASRVSYWYALVGVIWLVYRGLVIRRGFVLCKHYGERCDQLGESLDQQQAMVFVQESLRLTAHGASNYQRCALLYLIIEGIMTDLFLIIANDGWATRIQYASMGYNLSGLMLVLFEMLEATCYETALVGELGSALAFQTFLSGLNDSHLQESKQTALAISYYLWSLMCHAIVVVVVLSVISTLRTVWACLYLSYKHRSLTVLSEPCCVDTALGTRSRIAVLGGLERQDGKLFYKPAALKAFGMLKVDEEGIEYLALQKLHWFTVPREAFVGIGVITDQRVEPCSERPCTGIVSFLDKNLGGPATQTNHLRTRPTSNIKKVLATTERLDTIP